MTSSSNATPAIHPTRPTRPTRPTAAPQACSRGVGLSFSRATLLFARLFAVQLVRGRVAWVAGVAATCGLGLSVLAAHGAVRDHARIVADFSLTSLQLAACGVAVAAAVGGTASDASARLDYTWLARPVPRGALLLGRFFGLWAVLVALVAAIASAGAANLCLLGGPVPHGFAAAAAMTALEAGVLAAVSLLLATLVAPPLAAAAAVVLFAAGHFSDAWTGLAQAQGPMPRGVALAYHALPDFGRLSLRGWAAAGQPVPTAVWLHAWAYGLSYLGAALSLATLAYARRRDL